jgi:hypothetical protein
MRSTFKTAIASAATTAVSTLNDSGTFAGGNIQYQGGYEVGTTNQNGETFLDGLNGNGYGIYSSGKLFNTINLCSCYRYNHGISFTSTSNKNYIDTIANSSNNTNYGISISSSSYGNILNTLRNINNNNIGIYIDSSQDNYINAVELCNNNFNNGITLLRSNYCSINKLIAKRNGGSAIQFSSSTNCIVKDMSTSNNLTNSITNQNTNYIIDALINESTEVSNAQWLNGFLWSYNHDKTSGNHWGFTYHATVNWQTATKHDTEPGAWKTAITGNSRTTAYPVKLKIAEVAFNASSLVTVKAWVKKDHATNVACRLVAYANSSVGITEQTTTKASDTDWEELTITFTPTAAGVTEIYLESWYVAGNSNTYCGTLTISQA